MTFQVATTDSTATSRLVELLKSEALDCARDALLHVISRQLQLQSIRAIEINKCGLNGKQAEALGQCLIGCSSLEVLSVTTNPVGDVGGAAMLKNLSEMSSLSQLRVLRLAGSELGLEAAGALSRLLPQLRGLEVLRLSGNKGFGDAGGEAICRALDAPFPLRELVLGTCGLGAAAAVALAKSLLQLRDLQMLSLGNSSGIGDAGVAAVCRALGAQAPMRELRLHRGSLGSEAATALGESLPQLRDLQVLRLEDNRGLGDAGGAAVCRGLSAQGAGVTLRELYLRNCSLGAGAAEALSRLLSQARGLEMLDLGSNPGLSDAGGAAVCRSLAVPGSVAPMRELRLRKCGLGAETAEALAGVLPQLCVLQVLDLNWNPGLGDAGGVTVCRALAAHGAELPLRQLWLECGMGAEFREALVGLSSKVRDVCKF
ncbi:unnamed protein product [Prorocentrum cordatum]|uniref:Uncharacterized protein n=1 Tax=Prorocentrum cordatum TaxID=2364126 RepID=A0ABN9T502_9DINO|nr:unnamed protein product [Polarella glacialis]